MSNGECAVGAGLKRDVAGLHESDERQWTAIDQLRNRLPLWATTVISLLTFCVGVLLTVAVQLARRLA